ncbi:MAG: hypothetical protein QG597_3225 [Actinomycetota bacterium]|nr:hypothetical protein [Actinomycetota bacterium]
MQGRVPGLQRGGSGHLPSRPWTLRSNCLATDSDARQGKRHQWRSAGALVLNFGREDPLDPVALRRLVSSLTCYLGDPDPCRDEPDRLRLSVTDSRSGGC